MLMLVPFRAMCLQTAFTLEQSDRRASTMGFNSLISLCTRPAILLMSSSRSSVESQARGTCNIVPFFSTKTLSLPFTIISEMVLSSISGWRIPISLRRVRKSRSISAAFSRCVHRAESGRANTYDSIISKALSSVISSDDSISRSRISEAYLRLSLLE